MTTLALVVDDEPDTRALLRMILELRGYAVDEAGTGEDALSSMREHAPDVVLLDLRMPGLDGWDVLGQMRDDPALRAVKVVVISAHTSPDTGPRALEHGAAGFVTKPFQWDEVTGAIERALSA
jgi:CheY-like chemotaxis protein